MRSLVVFWIAAPLSLSAANTFPASGNVGIGTTDPATTLDVQGTLRVSGLVTYNGGVLDLVNGDSSGGAVDTAGIRTWNTLRFYSTCTGYTSAANYGIQFSPRDGSAIFKGKVGIGLTDGIRPLEIVGEFVSRYSANAGSPALDIQPTAQGATIWLNPSYSAANPYTGWKNVLNFDSVGRVGVLTSTTMGSLTVYGGMGNSHASNLTLLAPNNAQGYNVGVSFYPTFLNSSDNGPRRAADIMAGFAGGAWGTQYLSLRVGNLQNENGDATPEVMRLTGAGNVGIGTSTPSHKLAVNGTIRARELIVDNTSWPDYVFTRELQPLPVLEEKIKNEGKLPGIPSAASVLKEGVDVGQMQAKLLEKIEEITLYVIEQDKQIRQLQVENQKLKASLEALVL
ncbi:MAG: tail fiber protein [Opitutaceae bacterium]|nr:tail fiber protein [Opitutaceae bacterium]